MKGYAKDLSQIVQHYGVHHQLAKASEEFQEASEAADDYSRTYSARDFEHLAEELADAQIMIDQLRMFIPNLAEHMEAQKAFKVKRTLLRISIENTKRGES